MRGDDVRGRGFAPKGQTPVIHVNHKRHGLSIISSITNKGEMRWKIFDGALNADIFIDFLKRLIKNAPKKIFLIVDNLRVHHAKPVKVWLAEHEAFIEVFYLPSCALSSTPTRWPTPTSSKPSPSWPLRHQAATRQGHRQTLAQCPQAA